MPGGPAPGARCVVCNSPDRPAIEAAEASGVSRREIARRYGLGKDAVNRHFYGNHPGVPGAGSSLPDAAPPVQPPLPPPDELSELERLKVTRAVLVKELEREVRSDTAREIRQLSERIAALSGEHVAKVARVEDVEGLPELIEALFRALEPFPEARAAMHAALEEHPLGV